WNACDTSLLKRFNKGEWIVFPKSGFVNRNVAVDRQAGSPTSGQHQCADLGMAEGLRFKLDAFRRSERHGSLLPKSRAKPRDRSCNGGGRGIRTAGTVTRTVVFKFPKAFGTVLKILYSIRQPVTRQTD